MNEKESAQDSANIVSTPPYQNVQAQSISVDTLFDYISDGFVILNREWRYIYVNQQTEKALGINKEDILGKTVWEAYPESQGTVFQQSYFEAMNTQQTVTFEAYYPHSQRWYALNLYPSLTHLSILYKDITVQKHTEQRLHYLASLAQSISDAVIATDLEYRVVSWNTAAEKLYGWTEDEVLGKLVCDFVPTQLTDASYTEWSEQLYAQGYWNGEYTQTGRDGKIFHISSATSLVKDSMGQVLGTVAVNRDITDRVLREEENKHLKLLTEKLLANETRFHQVVDTNIIGFMFWNLQGEITEANDAFLETVGYSRAELEAGMLRWSDLTPPEFKVHDQEAITELQHNGILTHAIEKEYIRKDGSRIPILIRGVFLDEAQQEGVAFVLDISERKELEQRKDEFISMASHELKTPITTLKGFTQLLKKQFVRQGLDEPVIFLSRMETQIDRLTRLIKELLDVSKIQAGHMDYTYEPINVDAFVRDAVENFQQTIYSHTIFVEGATRSQIQGDKDHLTQVLLNLLSNAVKYSPASNKVDVILRSEAEQIFIEVQDYGVGIPQEDQDRIFERFYRVTAPYEKRVPGLGMGLYIANEIVQHHNGNISVSSTQGQGTVFSVRLAHT